ncbi:MAG: hypothetical protein RL357_738 [Pseudomonadota bacterium]
MEQALHFEQECDALDALLCQLEPGDWEQKTAFKDWTINDIMVHLYFWNQMAAWSIFDPETFGPQMDRVMANIQRHGMRSTENDWIEERGGDLHRAWSQHYRSVGPKWRDQDPKKRVRWAGPDMSIRSSVTARQMETWAHAQAIFDVFGMDRAESDRLYNIVMLGFNTFGWTHKVRGWPIPAAAPELRLIAPSGLEWRMGDANDQDWICGAAVDFARVVTQTRHVADTALEVHGDIAKGWMQHAQCFAGAAQEPPPPGSRYKKMKGSMDDPRTQTP